MLLRNKLMISSLVACAVLASSAATAKPMKNGKFGVGFQLSWPSYGLSVKKELTNEITAQGTIGAFGTVTNFGAKAMYKFKKEPEYDIYGYGSLGVYKWSGSGLFASESVMGFGAGAGLEYDVTKEITVNGEIGFGAVNFDHYSYGSFGMGLGAHYWF